MRKPSTSAIEHSLEQIRRATEAADQLSTVERAAKAADRYLSLPPDPYGSAYRETLNHTSAVQRATDVLAYPARHTDLVAYDGAIGHVQDDLERARRLGEMDPYAGAESPIAAATRQLIESAHLAQTQYDDPELDIRRRAAEAAGLSPRGAIAYAREELERARSSFAHDLSSTTFRDHEIVSGYRPASAPAPIAPTSLSPASRGAAAAPARTFADDLKDLTRAPRRVSRRRASDPPQTRTPVPVDSVAQLGEQLRLRRIEMGLTQQEFADMAGVGRRFISDLEGGKESVELGRVIRVCHAAGLRFVAG